MPLLSASAPTLALVALALPAAAQCPDLDVRFKAPRDDGIRALAVFDDGSGPKLVAGGSSLGLTSWDGQRWAPLGANLDGGVNALLVHDFGSGPELVVAGQFLHADGATVNRVARFDGGRWSALGAGFDGLVNALAVFDGGSGPRLVATGSFTASGATPVASIATFTGSAWAPLGLGLDAPGSALAVLDTGTASELVAGGEFLQAGGSSAAHVARWNGSSWSALGSGAGGTDGDVLSLLAIGAPGAQSLVAGGRFQNAGGVAASLVALFDGASWSALGPGLDPSTVFDAGVLALIADGAGFLAGGRLETFAPPGSVSTNLARWSGSAWQPLGTGLGIPKFTGVDALARFDPNDGGGMRVFAGGGFMPRTGQPKSIAQWDGATWSALLDADAQGLIHAPGQAGALRATMWQGELVVAGEFDGAGSAPAAQGIARWDGVRWNTLGTAPASGYIDHPTVVDSLDLGTGSELVLGMVRYFTHDARVPVYRWDGIGWAPFEPGALPSRTIALVMDVETFDDGGGAKLFAAGNGLRPTGSSEANSIVRWTGSAWAPVGTGAPAIDSTVLCLEAFDDGGGPALYAGGTMPGAIVRWSGGAWSIVGGVMSALPGVTPSVSDIAVFDAGAGARLYAGGTFTSAGGVSARGIARWTGSAWEAVPGVDPQFPGVASFAVFGDASGAGRRLYAMDLVDDLWAFDGSAWTRVGFTEPYFTGGRISAFEDLPGGAGLVIHGNFREAFEVGRAPVAMPGFTILRACPRITSFCAGDGGGAGGGVPCPCGNDGASGRGCENSGFTGGALLSASGVPSLESDTLVLTSSGERPTALSIFLQGSVEIAPTIYGDGLRCTGGALKRLYTRNAVGGTVSAPTGGDPSVSARSAALGNVIPPEGARFYQVYYRDPVASFCPTAPGGTFNVSSGQRVIWAQ